MPFQAEDDILKVIPDKEFKRLWTLQEEMYLFNNKNKTNEELAIDLNRTVNAIKRKKERFLGYLAALQSED